MLTEREIEQRIEKIDHYLKRIEIINQIPFEPLKNEIERFILNLKNYQTQRLNKEFKKEIYALSSKMRDVKLMNKQANFFIKCTRNLIEEISSNTPLFFSVLDALFPSCYRKVQNKLRIRSVALERFNENVPDNFQTRSKRFICQKEQDIKTRFSQKIRELNLNSNSLFEERWWTEDFENLWYEEIEKLTVLAFDELTFPFNIVTFLRDKWRNIEGELNEIGIMQENFLFWISNEIFFSERQYAGIPEKKLLTKLKEIFVGGAVVITRPLYRLTLEKQESFFSAEHTQNKRTLVLRKGRDSLQRQRQLFERKKTEIESGVLTMRILAFIWSIMKNQTPNNLKEVLLQIDQRAQILLLEQRLVNREEERQIEFKCISKVSSLSESIRAQERNTSNLEIEIMRTLGESSLSTRVLQDNVAVGIPFITFLFCFFVLILQRIFFQD